MAAITTIPCSDEANDDLCWVCQKNSTAVLRAVNDPESLHAQGSLDTGATRAIVLSDDFGSVHRLVAGDVIIKKPEE